MLDIGWTELLVIAIVLIVVVGPKDLPPMIRAFGRTMAKLRTVTGEFRSQFDEALKEADMDGVRKTLSDVQSLNPSSALRDAINPLRDIGNDIRNDLEKSVKTSSSESGSTREVAPATEVKVPEPQMKLPDSAPTITTSEPVLASVAASETSSVKAAPVAKDTKAVAEPKASKAKAKRADVTTSEAATTKAAPKKTTAKKATEKKAPVEKTPTSKKAEKENQ